MKNKAKIKDFKLKLSADDPEGTIEGYVSKFNVRDSYNEVVMPGAFSDSLSRQRREGEYPLMLWQHDYRLVIGKWDDLSDDGQGLYGKGRLLIKQSVPQADTAYALLKADAIWGQSIGYREVDVEVGTNGEPTRLIKLDLMESSIVSFPANRRAYVTAVKAEEDAEQWERMRELARKFRDGEPLPVKEYEELLREAGFPRSVATQIASVGYMKSIQGEPGGQEATSAVLERLRQAAGTLTAKK